MAQKIAIVVPNYESSGGVRTVANFIKENLVKKGAWDIEIISLATSSTDKFSRNISSPKTWFNRVNTNVYWESDIKVTQIGCNWSELEWYRYKPHKVLTDKLNTFDLIQVVAGTPAWSVVTRDADVPVALQVATLTKVERKEKLKSTNGALGLWKKWMTEIASRYDKKGLRIVDAIFVENNWMYKELGQRGHREKTFFSPPGIDTDVFSPIPDDESKSHILSPYILTVGRLNDPRKDVRTLFKAYSLINRELSDPPKLVLAGKKMPSSEQIEIAKILGIYQDVVLQEDIPLPKLINLYQNAELFLLTSREEGLGMVIMEAMACGTPVISTDSGGPSTIIENGENGYLCQIGNYEEISNKSKNLLSNENLRNSFIKNGLTTISEKFSSDKTIKKFERVYDELIQPEKV